MTKLEEYLQCRHEWSDASCRGDEDRYKEWLERGLRIRDSFSREDWVELINQSSGRAKFEYTKMMNAKFPEEDEAMRLFGLNK